MMNSENNEFSFFGTQGTKTHRNVRKARVVGEHCHCNPVEYDPHYIRYEQVPQESYNFNSTWVTFS